MNHEKIKDALLKAQVLVSDIENQGLKEKAFEVVLSKLLLKNGGKTQKIRTTRKVKKDIHRLTAPSSLKFDETQLLSLIEYYDRFKITEGSELCIFILACFLKEILNLITFSLRDLDYTYQQLINSNVTTRPLTLKSEDIKRALRWLVAPSRKKQWLELSGNDQYSLSVGGILKLRDLKKANEEKEENNSERTSKILA